MALGIRTGSGRGLLESIHRTREFEPTDAGYGLDQK